MDLDPTTLAIGLRQTERLLIVLGGILAVLLGYRLFMNLPMLERGAGKIQLPGGISIFLTRIGPGVFFALFGTGVLAYSLHQEINISAGAPAATVPGGGPQAAASDRLVYGGSSSAARAAADAEVRQAERNGVVGTIRVLRAIEGTVESTWQGQAKLSALIGLDDAKARLMRGVWDDRDWGPRDAFEAWRNAGMPQPAPAAIARAADVFGESRR
ncbi:MAG: hypothetical protein JNK67_18250 [Alphaproteobacteria bacterium]|nr:hypothetical protein [Alphaproteobacteria bacterium]